MRDKTSRHKIVFCEFVQQELKISWNEIIDYDGMKPMPMRVTMRGCSEVGKDQCPVRGVPGHMDFSPCPHFPHTPRV